MFKYRKLYNEKCKELKEQVSRTNYYRKSEIETTRVFTSKIVELRQEIFRLKFLLNNAENTINKLKNNQGINSAVQESHYDVEKPSFIYEDTDSIHYDLQSEDIKVNDKN